MVERSSYTRLTGVRFPLGVPSHFKCISRSVAPRSSSSRGRTNIRPVSRIPGSRGGMLYQWCSMRTAVFKENDMYKPLASIQRDRDGIAGFLLRHGVIKSPAVAISLLLALCSITIVVSIFLLYETQASAAVVPYSELSSSVKSSFPAAVQKLHQSQL